MAVYNIEKGKSSAGMVITRGNIANVRSNGVVFSTTVMSAGKLFVSQAGTAHNTILNAGGSMIVSSGGKVSNTLIFPLGTVRILRGGFANSTTIRYGTLYISSGGLASNSVIEDGGSMVIEQGTAGVVRIDSGGTLFVTSGTAAAATVNAGGSMSIQAGGSAVNIGINDGFVFIESNGYAKNITVSSGRLEITDKGLAETVNVYGSLYVSSGGSAIKIKECGGAVMTDSGATVSFESNTLKQQTWNSLTTLHSGTTADSCTIGSGGTLLVFSGGSADNTQVKGSLCVFAGGIMTNTAVAASDKGSHIDIYSSGIMQNTVLYQGAIGVNGKICDTVVSGGSVTVSSGGIAAETILKSGGILYLGSGGIHTGNLQIEQGAVVTAEKGTELNFSVSTQNSPQSALLTDWKVIRGRNDISYTLTVSAKQAEGKYVLAGNAADFSNVISVKNTEGTELGLLSTSQDLDLGNKTSCRLFSSSSNLILEIFKNDVPDPQDGVRWQKLSGASSYIVEYSQDLFLHSTRIQTALNGVDTPSLPQGEYQWRVKTDSGTLLDGGTISAKAVSSPQELNPQSNGISDIFFAQTSGVWESQYQAQHQGCGTWNGLGTYVNLAGKNVIADFFSGSEDANILLLTDSANGDALFLDDIYTALPESIDQPHARISQIDEIRAGAGDDIVDLTSRRFSCQTEGMTIRGGDGDDILWSNEGENSIFGDNGNDNIIGAAGNDMIAGGSGNDYMHGGGGDDLFCFCENCGNDQIEQLTNGSVTLWFAKRSGSWDPDSMTWSDGVNSVKVTGTSSVVLKYGDDGTAQYEQLVSSGAFAECSSLKIFENEGQGTVAVL